MDEDSEIIEMLKKIAESLEHEASKPVIIPPSSPSIMSITKTDGTPIF